MTDPTFFFFSFCELLLLFEQLQKNKQVKVVFFGSMKELTLFLQPYFLKDSNVQGLQFTPLQTPFHFFQSLIISRCCIAGPIMSFPQLMNLNILFGNQHTHLPRLYQGSPISYSCYTLQNAHYKSNHGVKMKGFHYLPRCFLFSRCLYFVQIHKFILLCLNPIFTYDNLYGCHEVYHPSSIQTMNIQTPT